MTSSAREPHWLDQYGGDSHEWRQAQHDGRTCFYRPLGLVEFCFDADGRYFEGRADMTIQLDLNIASKLSKVQFREHITLAWACLRMRHVLLQSKALKRQSWMEGKSDSLQDLFFVVESPLNRQEALSRATSHLAFLDEHFESIDPLQFYIHSMNCARIVDPDVGLAKLFALPIQSIEGKQKLSFVLVNSHQIQDGIVMYRWMTDFLWLLNQSTASLERTLDEAIKVEALQQHLPPSQETLYPSISGSRAKKRWFWLLTRILRHVRRPHAAGFPNPLRRQVPLSRPMTPPAKYAPALDYKRTPPNNSTTCRARAGKKSADRLIRLCRDTGVSIGAGGFALAAILMMEFYENRDPEVHLHERKPFITGFPLNPRPFLSSNPVPDSLMLAFCDGIVLPFLPSSLDLDGRIRLLARQAQRQLAAYQKRVRPQADQEGIQYMSSRGAGRVLAIQYLSSLERCDAILPSHLRNGSSVQGAYPMRPNTTTQTCGVSSLGKQAPLGGQDSISETSDFVATPENLYAGVRARDGEFLIGTGGGETGLFANVSIDSSTMDPDLVAAWSRRFGAILEEGQSPPNLPRL